MAGFVDNLSKRAGQRKRTREQLGLQSPEPTPGERASTPPINPTGPGTPDAPPATRATQQAPQPTPGAAPPASPLGDAPPELQESLQRMLTASESAMLTDKAKALGRPGDDRQVFFNIFGHMPTPREVSGFKLRLDMEKKLGRPPTVAEVKARLREADFIDRTPEPFGL